MSLHGFACRWFHDGLGVVQIWDGRGLSLGHPHHVVKVGQVFRGLVQVRHRFRLYLLVRAAALRLHVLLAEILIPVKRKKAASCAKMSEEVVYKR